MTISELLPYLNLLLPIIAGYVVTIEKRITRLEALREADETNDEKAARQLWLHRRKTDDS